MNSYYDYSANAEKYNKILYQHNIIPDLYQNYQNVLFLQAIDSGIPDDMLEFMTNVDFDSNQTNAVFWALQKGLSAEQMEVVANPELDQYQMNAVSVGFDRGLSVEQVKTYALPEIPAEKMVHMRDAFEHRMTPKQVRKMFSIKEPEKDKKADKAAVKNNDNPER